MTSFINHSFLFLHLDFLETLHDFNCHFKSTVENTADTFNIRRWLMSIIAIITMTNTMVMKARQHRDSSSEFCSRLVNCSCLDRSSCSSIGSFNTMKASPGQTIVRSKWIFTRCSCWSDSSFSMVKVSKLWETYSVLTIEKRGILIYLLCMM